LTLDIMVSALIAIEVFHLSK